MEQPPIHDHYDTAYDEDQRLRQCLGRLELAVNELPFLLQIVASVSYSGCQSPLPRESGRRTT